MITKKFPSEHFKCGYTDDELISIRGLWLSGKSMNDINHVLKNGLDICTEYFGFTLPWAINAIARKLYDMDFVDEGEQFSDLAMVVELGLPSYNAARVYLSGIRSRVAATELASVLRFSKDASVVTFK